MIAELPPAAYDIEGEKVAQPKSRSWYRDNVFSIGRFMEAPISVACESIDDCRHFLSTCALGPRTESKNYARLAEDFESSREGDAETFALWSWKALLFLGRSARYVCGRSPVFGPAHSWVTFTEGAGTYLLEPLASRAPRVPRLEAIRYKPVVSMEWAAGKAVFFEHGSREFNPGLGDALAMGAESLWLHARGWRSAIADRVRI